MLADKEPQTPLHLRRDSSAGCSGKAVMLMKWWLKSCPRCGGDLYGEAYGNREDIVCLQCSAVFYHQPPLEGVAITRRSKREPLAVSA